MNQTSKRVLIFLLAGILLLAACAPAAPPATLDPAFVQRQIQEAVALTVAAQNAQTEQAQALIPDPTNTPLPTQTEVVILPTQTDVPAPTATPFVVVAPPSVAPSTGSGGGSVPVSPPDFACTSRNRQPLDNTVFNRNKEFDIRWTIVNTGTKSWPAGKDVKFLSGPLMSTTSLAELPAMAPGDTFEIILDAVAPAKRGFHVMTWVVEGALCYPYVAINVE